MRILIGCEESQAVTKAFRELGFEVYSCDLLPCSGGHPEWHLNMDVFKAVQGGSLITEAGTVISIEKWTLGIFFPDCTYLTVTANKWLKDQPARKSGALVGKERRDAREREAFNSFLNYITAGLIISPWKTQLAVCRRNSANQIKLSHL